MTIPRRRRAFTIAEMSVSLAVLSILMVAMGSAIAISARALPTPSSPVNADLALSAALDRLGAELRYAKTIESSGATFVQFLVADRNGDSSDERIRYEWLGAGQSLTRAYNGAAPVPVSDALSNFSLSFQKKKITTTQTVNTTVDSGEVLFTSAAGWSGLTPTQSNSTLNMSNWAGSYFKPDKVTIPGNVTSVSITRVRVLLKRTATPDGANITCGILTPASPGGPLPSLTQIGSSATIAVSTLGTNYSTYNDFTFSDVTFATAPTELDFLIKGTGSSCGSVQYYNNNSAPANNPVWFWTASSGGSWSPQSSKFSQNDGVFEVYGSYRYPGVATVSTDTYYLHTFTLVADASGSASHAEVTARALNQPAVTGP
jgi:prepilin-type N-terminal cleavage/methylation domain-containing protein